MYDLESLLAIISFIFLWCLCYSALKVETKPSGISSRKPTGLPRGRPRKNSVKPVPESGGDRASPAESRESNDSDDVPLVIDQPSFFLHVFFVETDVCSLCDVHHVCFWAEKRCLKQM